MSPARACMDIIEYLKLKGNGNFQKYIKDVRIIFNPALMVEGYALLNGNDHLA